MGGGSCGSVRENRRVCQSEAVRGALDVADDGGESRRVHRGLAGPAESARTGAGGLPRRPSRHSECLQTVRSRAGRCRESDATSDRLAIAVPRMEADATRVDGVHRERRRPRNRELAAIVADPAACEVRLLAAFVDRRIATHGPDRRGPKTAREGVRSFVEQSDHQAAERTPAVPRPRYADDERLADRAATVPVVKDGPPGPGEPFRGVHVRGRHQPGPTERRTDIVVDLRNVRRRSPHASTRCHGVRLAQHRPGSERKLAEVRKLAGRPAEDVARRSGETSARDHFAQNGQASSIRRGRQRRR